MMLYEYLQQGFLTEGDWNCAERMLRGASVAYGLNLPDAALRLAAGFGGGMGTGDVCGVLSGAVMALSALFVKEYAHESGRIKALSQEMTRHFREALDEIDCTPLKERYRTPEEGCGAIILAGARILDDIVARERA